VPAAQELPAHGGNRRVHDALQYLPGSVANALASTGI
jgi:hypothetical protein